VNSDSNIDTFGQVHVAPVSLLEIEVEEARHLRLCHLPVESSEIWVFHGVGDSDAVIWMEGEHLLQKIDCRGVGGRGKE
jgi:hypothetical protein